MSSWFGADFDTETPREKRERQQRARDLALGSRGIDGLTPGERAVLDKLRLTITSAADVRRVRGGAVL